MRLVGWLVIIIQVMAAGLAIAVDRESQSHREFIEWRSAFELSKTIWTVHDQMGACLYEVATQSPLAAKRDPTSACQVGWNEEVDKAMDAATSLPTNLLDEGLRLQASLMLAQLAFRRPLQPIPDFGVGIRSGCDLIGEASKYYEDLFKGGPPIHLVSPQKVKELCAAEGIRVQ